MLPIINVGPFVLPTYPFFWLLAFWTGLWLAARQARRYGFDGDHIYNVGLFALIAGIVGARLWFVLSHWQNYAPDLWQALSLSRSALSPEAGLAVAGLVAIGYAQYHQISVSSFFDALSPGIVLALVIGSVGAFLGGESLGVTASVPWAVEIAGTPRHPVQLYQAVACLAILGFILLVTYRPWPGFKFCLFVLLYSLIRLLLELFKASPALVGDGFLAVQVWVLLAMVITLAVMAHNYRKDSNATITGSESL